MPTEIYISYCTTASVDQKRIKGKVDTPVIGFALELQHQGHSIMAYVIIYFCLFLMASFNDKLSDKLSPLAVVVSRLTVYLDCINLYLCYLSYLNGFHIVSNIVLLHLIPIFGNIRSSYLRKNQQEAAAKKVECITTVVVPLISVVVIVLFYFFGADVEDKVGADLEAGRIEL